VRNNSAKLAAVIEALLVWNTEAKKRNMDNEDKCTGGRTYKPAND